MGTKISELSYATSNTGMDLLPIVDSTGPTTKKVTLFDLFKAYSVPIILSSDDDDYFCSLQNMKNGSFTLLNTVMPNSVPRKIKITITPVSSPDTEGTITINGTDGNNAAISDTIDLLPGGSFVTPHEYLSVTSISISGWSAAETTDLIKIGYIDYSPKPVIMYAPPSNLLDENQTFFINNANMRNGSFTLTTDKTYFSDGTARPISCFGHSNGGADTTGILTIVGTDIDGNEISDTLTIENGALVYSDKAFFRIRSITQSGWTQVDGIDTIDIGLYSGLGLRHATTTVPVIITNETPPKVVSDPAVGPNLGQSVAETWVDIGGLTTSGSVKLIVFYYV